jgi:hypothetical protein
MGGKGVPQDWEEAARWFRKAADQGNATAEFNLGSLSEAGATGLSKDDAARWYRKAADQNYPYAQEALGGLYLLGQGVPQDKVSAYMWMTLASGAPGAESSRDELAAKIKGLAAKMTPQEITEAQRQAREWRPSSK